MTNASHNEMDRHKDNILKLETDNRKREELLDSTNKSFSDLIVVLDEMKSHNKKLREEFFAGQRKISDIKNEIGTLNQLKCQEISTHDGLDN
jgi:hypothetical protein